MSRKFRKKALDHLSSPEQLDQLMQVSSPKGWVSLIGLLIILAFALFWGIWGSVSTKVEGMGILIKPGGVAEVVSLGEGQVAEIKVQVGSQIKKGQVVAHLVQHELIQQIENSRQALAEVEKQHQLIESLGHQQIDLQENYYESAIDNLEQSGEVVQERMTWLQEKIENEKNLLNEGIIIKKDVKDSNYELEQIGVDLARLKNDINKNKQQFLAEKGEKELSWIESRMRISEVRRQIDLLEKRMHINSEVISPFDGRVLEVSVREGSVVSKGQMILSLEKAGDNETLEAVIYMNPSEGKKVKKGMFALITPTTVQKEEFGAIIGDVSSVSQFPITPEAIRQTLSNPRLVQQFTETGAPIAVYAKLKLDPSTLSGYQWTSPQGPPFKVFSGSLCHASVVVRKQAPITLIIPYFKKKLGL